MGHIGFSYVGLIYLLALFIPNILWAMHKPEGYTADAENPLLVMSERVGQVLVTICAMCFSDYNLKELSGWTLWLVVSLACMVLYELFWVRYFCGGNQLRDFYRPMFGIPCPGAVLPVAAFALLGVYGKVIWLVIAVLILAVGHIGIHIGHYHTVTNEITRY